MLLLWLHTWSKRILWRLLRQLVTCKIEENKFVPTQAFWNNWGGSKHIFFPKVLAESVKHNLANKRIRQFKKSLFLIFLCKIQWSLYRSYKKNKFSSPRKKSLSLPKNHTLITSRCVVFLILWKKHKFQKPRKITNRPFCKGTRRKEWRCLLVIVRHYNRLANSQNVLKLWRRFKD